MDQSKDIFGITSKCSIDFHEVLRFPNEKRVVARRRWAILAKALKSPTESQPSSPTDECSVRRISSFMLLKTQELTSLPLVIKENQNIDQLKKYTWYKYSICINGSDYFLDIAHRNRTFSAEDLMGFNNTGNICIWPSEETLSYFVCSNLEIFRDKNVIELGGGMSCLAGLFAAKYGRAKSVLVSDGNKVSVENVQITLKCNEFGSEVSCAILEWSSSVIKDQYDVVLCADCLFFDDARTDLINCLWCCLANNGTAYIMAPQRGTTLNMFIKQSEEKGFTCKMILRYSDVVWDKRLALLDNCDFDDNIHYPILIEVTKE
ncbi:calmodulin-lysine N-methyltransferase [Diorhabda carinulata]|uniref:calmodulin-lysine N-methyltransferase n=1 Tax=Diorhabda carinulata TaxID=1163345 RepID=UPI0025A050C3|nr:calmodulin-lysine N-methyltransferase [Diorhabda carinulata]